MYVIMCVCMYSELLSNYGNIRRHRLPIMIQRFCLLRQMSEENPEMREMAARICRDYLYGVWKHVTTENITLKRIRLVIAKRLSVSPAHRSGHTEIC